ncbi:MAG: hypothetical protein ACKOEO_18400 [Planctomycetaceae bacterium]
MAHTSSRHTLLLLATACLLIGQTGCAKLMHNLKPHRLRMLNYNSSSSGRDDVYFSVSDPLTPTPPNSLPTAVVPGP